MTTYMQAGITERTCAICGEECNALMSDWHGLYGPWHNDDDPPGKITFAHLTCVKRHTAGLQQRIAKLEAVADAARAALAWAEERHRRSARAADNWNNNVPGVGQTVDYMSVEPLPDWAEALRTALDAKGDAH